MQFTMKATALMMAGILALGMFAPAAHAVSLPYIDDVNDWGKGKVITTIHAAGYESQFRFTVKDAKTKKHVRVKMHRCKDCGKKHIATAVLKRGHVYRITVKAKDGKRYNTRSIGYCVY